MTSVFVVFFFQAEDGIRDRDVTGVQTCALPIYLRSVEHRTGQRCPVDGPQAGFQSRYFAGGEHRGKAEKKRAGAGGPRIVDRSEERRVGKEWRSRRGPYH